MKFFNILVLFLAFYSVAFADIDLDQNFLRATSSTSSLARKDCDVSDGFSSIVSQEPLGACQSFAVTAMIEYIFYRETGHVIKLSEKQVTYNVLNLLIDDFWDKDIEGYIMPVCLGYADLYFDTIEAVTKYGVIPSVNYPWGDLRQDSSKHLDIYLHEEVFGGRPPRFYSPDEYRGLLDEVFFSPPPKRFNYAFKKFDFALGCEYDVVLRTPEELIGYLGVAKDRFTVCINKDWDSPLFQYHEEDIKFAQKYFEANAEKKNIPHEMLSGDKIVEKIVDSLERRMVVEMIGSVWFGDWLRGNVFYGGGGHATVIVGYQNRGDDIYFKIRNSWGKDIGIDGYNYVSASVLLPNITMIYTYK